MIQYGILHAWLQELAATAAVAHCCLALAMLDCVLWGQLDTSCAVTLRSQILQLYIAVGHLALFECSSSGAGWTSAAQ